MEKFNIRDINASAPYNEQELMLIDLINQCIVTADRYAQNKDMLLAENSLNSAIHYAYALWYMRIETDSSYEMAYMQEYFNKAYQTMLHKDKPYIA